MSRYLPILVTLLMFFSTALAAAPRIRPHLRHPRRAPTVRPCSPGDAIRRIPWKLVAAGGAAASGVVFAYKISDGIQQGTVESARRAPETFIDKTIGIGETVKLIVCGVVLCAIVCLAWHFSRRSQ